MVYTMRIISVLHEQDIVPILAYPYNFFIKGILPSQDLKHNKAGACAWDLSQGALNEVRIEP